MDTDQILKDVVALRLRQKEQSKQTTMRWVTHFLGLHQRHTHTTNERNAWWI